MNEEFKKWALSLSELHLPRWEELPDIDLYRDQVITLVNRYLNFMVEEDESIITTSMINNYVKWKMMPAPNRKKQYSREHLGYLIVITILKQVVNIKDINNGVELLAKQRGTHIAYNLFCFKLEKSFRDILSLCFEEAPKGQIDDLIGDDELIISLGCYAFASKLVAVKRLAYESDKTVNYEE